MKRFIIVTALCSVFSGTNLEEFSRAIVRWPSGEPLKCEYTKKEYKIIILEKDQKDYEIKINEPKAKEILELENIDANIPTVPIGIEGPLTFNINSRTKEFYASTKFTLAMIEPRKEYQLVRSHNTLLTTCNREGICDPGNPSSILAYLSGYHNCIDILTNSPQVRQLAFSFDREINFPDRDKTRHEFKHAIISHALACRTIMKNGSKFCGFYDHYPEQANKILRYLELINDNGRYNINKIMENLNKQFLLLPREEPLWFERTLFEGTHNVLLQLYLSKICSDDTYMKEIETYIDSQSDHMFVQQLRLHLYPIERNVDEKPLGRLIKMVHKP